MPTRCRLPSISTDSRHNITLSNSNESQTRPGSRGNLVRYTGRAQASRRHMRNRSRRTSGPPTTQSNTTGENEEGSDAGYDGTTQRTAETVPG